MATLSADRVRSRRNVVVGVLAALGSVAIWGGWIVGTRYAVTHELDPWGVGLLRFGVPALLLLPVVFRMGLLPRGISVATLTALMGAGAPFFLIAAYAMQYAPAADVGPLLPGTMPLFVALIAVIVLGERLGNLRIFGLVLVAAGIVAIGGREILFGGAASRGHALLLCGALMWAVYTHAFKHSGLNAIEAAAVVSAWSTILLLPLGVPSLLGAVNAGHGLDVIMQAILQGVLSGLIAIVLYGVAIMRLGAARGAAFVALVPALAALLAIPALGEWPDVAAAIGIVATAVGVTLAAGAFDSQGRTAGG